MWNNFKDLKFLILFLGRLFSNFGDGLKYIVIAWLTYDQTDSVLMVGGVLSLTLVPGILLTPVIGVLLDRFDRRICAMVVEFMQSALLITWAYLLSTGDFSITLLYVFTGLLAIGQSVTLPALFSLVPEVFSKERILGINALMSIASQAGYLIGSSAGGFLITYLGVSGGLSINAITYFISGFALYFLRKGIVLPTSEDGGTIRNGLLSGLAQTISLTKDRGDIRVLILMGISTWLVTMVINVLLAPFTKDVLHVDTWGFGLLDAMIGIGAITGGILVGWVKKNLRKQIIGVGFVLTAILLVLFGANPFFIVAVLLNFMIGAVIEITSAFVDTYIQLRVDNNFLGRISSTIRFGGSILGPIFMYCFGAIAEHGSFMMAFGGMALYTALVGICAFLWGIRYDFDNTLQNYSDKGIA
jgi:MFS transporter, DHA3 family, macrolide efflux protein